ncbi:MAG: DNA cytosine methyltransferase [Actinobacteria bacterium]|nr:DNA cytosine methyltransferase [Actinomycetota bacterium]
MVAKVGSRGSTVDAVELFGGFGGTAQGVRTAGAEITVAANHLPIAVECYGRNFPEADVVRADLSDPEAGDYIDPAELPPARLLLASPSCRHHSLANAKKMYRSGMRALLPELEDEFDHDAYANSERSRVTMVSPLRYAAKHLPELVFVENVVEAAKWGPDRDGSTFRWWLAEWSKLGYEHKVLFLNSMFFPPCPQSRDRMYVCFWRKGNARPDLDYRPDAFCTSGICGGEMVKAVQTWKERSPAWPMAEWGKYRAQYLYTCPKCHRPVEPLAWPAYSAIDWSNLGTALGERDALGMDPLAEKTVERVRRALAKFRHMPPVVIPVKAEWGVDRSVFEPFVTQTAQQDKALVVHGATVVAAGNTFEREGSTCRSRHLGDPLWTQHATQAIGFAAMPTLVEMRGGGSFVSGQHAVTDPMHAITAGGMHHGLVSAAFTKVNGGPGDTAWHAVTDSLNTVTGRDTHALTILPWIEQWRSRPAAITESLATVMTHLRHSLCVAEAEVDSVAITDDELERVRFRMLEPDPELRRAMAFADDYELVGNKRQMAAGLGNAVTPPVAEWVVGRLLDTLSGRAREDAA